MIPFFIFQNVVYMKVSENRFCRGYWNLRGRKEDEGEKVCTMRRFTSCTLHKILLE